ncbi:hypothetical protein ACA910_008984 [Epithemia clementina (nom. ined.)]
MLQQLEWLLVGLHVGGCFWTTATASTTTTFQYTNAYCTNGYWALSNVEVECRRTRRWSYSSYFSGNQGDQGDNTEPQDDNENGDDDEEDGDICQSGDWLTVTGDIYAYHNLPANGYHLQVKICKPTYSSSYSSYSSSVAASTSCSFTKNYYSANICNMGYISSQDSSTMCGYKGNFEFGLDMAFKAPSFSSSMADGTPLYYEAILTYANSGSVFEKCVLEFIVQQQQYKYNYKYASVALILVGTGLLTLFGAQQRRQRTTATAAALLEPQDKTTLADAATSALGPENSSANSCNKNKNKNSLTVELTSNRRPVLLLS